MQCSKAKQEKQKERSGKWAKSRLKRKLCNRVFYLKTKSLIIFVVLPANTEIKNSNSVNGVLSFLKVLYANTLYHIPVNTFNKKPTADEIGHAFDAQRRKLDTWRSSSFILI